MGIIYYPDELQKKRPNRIDVQLRENTILGTNASHDLNGSALDYRLAVPEPSWEVELVTLHFSGATARNFSISLEQGRGVIEGLNDNLWVAVDGAVPQRIVLDEGFYTGDSLATEVQTKLNADTVFNELGITWTVAWVSATRKFTITPSAGEAAFLNVNTYESVRRNSKAGHVLGFTEDQAGAALTSDTECPNLGSKAAVASATASTVLDVVLTDKLSMDVDTALHIDASSVNLIVDYSVKYRLTDQA